MIYINYRLLPVFLFLFSSYALKISASNIDAIIRPLQILKLKLVELKKALGPSAEERQELTDQLFLKFCWNQSYPPPSPAELKDVQSFINMGGDVNAKGTITFYDPQPGYSLLHAAIAGYCKDREEMVKLLLDKNANPNIRITDSGSTPLHLAVFYYSLRGPSHKIGTAFTMHSDIPDSSELFLKIIKLLIQHKADCNIPMKFAENHQYTGDSPLSLASKDEDTKHANQLITLFLEKAFYINTNPQYYANPLVGAIKNHNVEVFKKLVAKGFDALVRRELPDGYSIKVTFDQEKKEYRGEIKDKKKKKKTIATLVCPVQDTDLVIQNKFVYKGYILHTTTKSHYFKDKKIKLYKSKMDESWWIGVEDPEGDRGFILWLITEEILNQLAFTSPGGLSLDARKKFINTYQSKMFWANTNAVDDSPLKPDIQLKIKAFIEIVLPVAQGKEPR